MTFTRNEKKKGYKNEVTGFLKKSTTKRKNMNSNSESCLTENIDNLGEEQNKNRLFNLIKKKPCNFSKKSVCNDAEHLVNNKTQQKNCLLGKKAKGKSKDENAAFVPFTADKEKNPWDKLMKEMNLEQEDIDFMPKRAISKNMLTYDNLEKETPKYPNSYENRLSVVNSFKRSMAHQSNFKMDTPKHPNLFKMAVPAVDMSKLSLTPQDNLEEGTSKSTNLCAKTQSVVDTSRIPLTYQNNFEEGTSEHSKFDEKMGKALDVANIGESKHGTESEFSMQTTDDERKLLRTPASVSVKLRYSEKINRCRMQNYEETTKKVQNKNRKITQNVKKSPKFKIQVEADGGLKFKGYCKSSSLSSSSEEFAKLKQNKNRIKNNENPKNKTKQHKYKKYLEKLFKEQGTLPEDDTTTRDQKNTKAKKVNGISKQEKQDHGIAETLIAQDEQDIFSLSSDSDMDDGVSISFICLEGKKWKIKI